MFLSVYLPNGIGIALMVMLLVTNRKHFEKDRRLKNLHNMIRIVIISGLCEILAFALDGKPGAAVTVLLYLTNSWVFLANILIAYSWLRLECDCIGVEPSKTGTKLINVIDGAGLLVLIVNLFYPVVFSLRDNVYSRCGFFWLFIAIGALNIIYGVVLYFISKRKGTVIASFSVGFFVTPLIIGMTIQSLYYGVSIIWASIAVAITGMASVLKDSLLDIDALTRVFNRYFLERITAENRGKKNHLFYGILADVNGFKKINDTLGHDVGDEVIAAAADVFKAAVKDRGMVIRYGGDEFVVLINTQEEAAVSGIVEEIGKRCKEYSEKNGHGLELSVSLGVGKYNSNEQSFEEFLNVLDKRMYLKKQEYHRLHEHTDTLNIRLGALPLSSNILNEANIGLWAMEKDEGREPRMYVDDVALHLLGLTEYVSPEEMFRVWYDSFGEDVRDLMKKALDRMIAGEHAEVQVPMILPDGTKRILRGGGIRNSAYKKGIRLEGIQQDVTETIHFDEEIHKRELEELSLRIMSALPESYQTLYYVDAETGAYQIITTDSVYSDDVDRQLQHTGDFFADTKANFPRVIYEEDYEKIELLADRVRLEEALGEQNSLSEEYRALIGGKPVWYRLKAARIYENGGRLHYALGLMCIKEEIETRKENEQTAKVLSALAADYGGIYYVKFRKEKYSDIGISYRTTSVFDRIFPDAAESRSFSKRLDLLMNNAVYEPDREQFYKDTRREKILEELSVSDTYVIYPRLMTNGRVRTCEMKFSAIREKNKLTGMVSGFRFRETGPA